MRLAVTVDVDAPVEAVWELLTHWERQPEWMLDAVDVEVLTPQRAGVGVTIRCPTRLLGVVVDDTMRVTVFEPPHRLVVQHLGRIIRGHGAFELAPRDGRTAVVWWEVVDVPFGPVGEFLATLFVLPLLERVFRRSL
ncbi:MAG: SRPBCC family protein, partial [Nitriliruptoraceae bacterium]